MKLLLIHCGCITTSLQPGERLGSDCLGEVFHARLLMDVVCD
jgi:hypothetical protein